MKLTEEKHREICKTNMKLYPIYMMFGYDLLFFYGIKVFYLSQVKGIGNAQIMLSSMFYAFFTIFLQFPSSVLVSKIGKRNTMILGNIINIFSVLVFIVLKSFTGLILAQLLSAIAFAFKSISESNLLTISIPESTSANEIFTTIDKKGYSRYCILSAISTILAGILFEVNGYLPMLCCLLFTIISTLISFNFGELEDVKKKGVTLKDYIKEIKQGYKFTINSKRLRALLLTVGAIWGIIALIDTYQLALLQNIGASSIQVGLVFALYEIAKAVSSQRAPEFNKRFKNRSLTNILAMFAFCLILCGSIAILNLSFAFKLFLIIIFIVIMGAMNGTSQILAKKYLNSFTNSKILTCIYSAKAISDNFCKVLITGMGSFILTFANINFAIIIAGIGVIVITFFLSMYMNGRVGLDPDEYTQKDIYIRK